MLTLSCSYFNTIQFALKQNKQKQQQKTKRKKQPKTRVYDVNNKVDFSLIKGT
jgi:hypothetical protein